MFRLFLKGLQLLTVQPHENTNAFSVTGFQLALAEPNAHSLRDHIRQRAESMAVDEQFLRDNEVRCDRSARRAFATLLGYFRGPFPGRILVTFLLHGGTVTRWESFLVDDVVAPPFERIDVQRVSLHCTQWRWYGYGLLPNRGVLTEGPDKIFFGDHPTTAR